MADSRRSRLPRCDVAIEREWPGHTAVLSRRYCKAYPMKGFDHCRHHLTPAERSRLNDLIQSYVLRVAER